MLSCRQEFMDVVVTPAILKLDKKSKTIRKGAGVEGLGRWQIHQNDFPAFSVNLDNEMLENNMVGKYM